MDPVIELPIELAGSSGASTPGARASTTRRASRTAPPPPHL